MLLLRDIEELVLVHGGCGAFPLELEDHDSSVMAGCKQIDLGVGSNNPESIHIPLEGLNGGPLIQIPSTDCLVFADGKNEVLVGVEETGGCILKMTSAGINFPCLGILNNVSPADLV